MFDKHYLFNVLHRLFNLKSPFTCLTPQDYDTFVEENIILDYGANRFLRSLASYLEHPPANVRGDLVKHTLPVILSDVGRIINRPAFYPHLTSSGILSAICDLADVPRKLGLPADADELWGLSNRVLQILRYVLFQRFYALAILIYD